MFSQSWQVLNVQNIRPTSSFFIEMKGSIFPQKYVDLNFNHKANNQNYVILPIVFGKDQWDTC